jgi:hypothetical protein
MHATDYKIPAACALALTTFGCTALRPEGESAATLNQLPEIWACLASPPAPPSGTLPQVKYTTRVEDWNTHGALGPDLLICVCSAADPVDLMKKPAPSCAQPLGPTACITPNMPGTPNPNVTITLPGQDGFLIAFLTGTTLPDALYFNHIPTKDITADPPIRLISATVATNIAQSFQVMLKGDLAILVLRAYDCEGQPASGVYFTVSPSPAGIQPFTYVLGNPTIRNLLTDASGQFGFANAAPGNTVATAYLASPGRSFEELTLITTGKMAPPASDTKIGDINIYNAAGSWATLGDVRPYQP